MAELQNNVSRNIEVDGKAVFTVRCKPGQHFCGFEVFEIFSTDPVFYWKDSAGNPVESIDDAQRFLHGSVRWDGCSNWHFDIQDDCMIHFCSVQEAESIGALFRHIYTIAADMIPILNSQGMFPESLK